MNLNPSTMRLGIASILVGLVGAYGVRNLMEEEEEPVVTVAPDIKLVPVANADLPAGRLIRRGDISFLPMSMSDINEQGWQPKLIVMDETYLIGRETKVRIPLQQPFLTTEIWLDGEGAGYTVTPGMRTAQIRVAVDRGGSQIEAGDIVDVYFTSSPRAAKNGQPAIPEKTIPLVEAAKVLHVQNPELSEIKWAIGYKAKSPIFTLELEPDVAGKVYAVQDYGVFSIMLRSSDDPRGRKSTAEEYTLASLLGIEPVEPPQPPPMAITEYWKGTGGRFNKTFPIPQPPAPPPSDQLAQRPAPKPAEVLPTAPTSAPPTNSRPRIPYRPDASSNVLPPAPTPATQDAAPTPPSGSGSSNPFNDDGEVLP